MRQAHSIWVTPWTARALRPASAAPHTLSASQPFLQRLVRRAVGRAEHSRAFTGELGGVSPAMLDGFSTRVMSRFPVQAIVARYSRPADPADETGADDGAQALPLAMFGQAEADESSSSFETTSGAQPDESAPRLSSSRVNPNSDSVRNLAKINAQRQLAAQRKMAAPQATSPAPPTPLPRDVSARIVATPSRVMRSETTQTTHKTQTAPRPLQRFSKVEEIPSTASRTESATVRREPAAPEATDTSMPRTSGSNETTREPDEASGDSSGDPIEMLQRMSQPEHDLAPAEFDEVMQPSAIAAPAVKARVQADVAQRDEGTTTQSSDSGVESESDSENNIKVTSQNDEAPLQRLQANRPTIESHNELRVTRDAKEKPANIAAINPSQAVSTPTQHTAPAHADKLESVVEPSPLVEATEHPVQRVSRVADVASPMISPETQLATPITNPIKTPIETMKQEASQELALRKVAREAVPASDKADLPEVTTQPAIDLPATDVTSSFADVPNLGSPASPITSTSPRATGLAPETNTPGLAESAPPNMFSPPLARQIKRMKATPVLRSPNLPGLPDVSRQTTGQASPEVRMPVPTTHARSASETASETSVARMDPEVMRITDSHINPFSAAQARDEAMPLARSSGSGQEVTQTEATGFSAVVRRASTQATRAASTPAASPTLARVAALPQRVMREPEMPLSTPTTATASTNSDLSILSTEAQPPAMNGVKNAAETTAPAPASPDVETLARQVYPLIKRLLAVERERWLGR